MRMTMGAFAIAFAAVSMTAIAAPASDETDVVAVVSHYGDSFNKGDVTAANTDCAPQVTIIDNFAPYIWQGATACADWSRADAADEVRQGISAGVVSFSKPWQARVTGDRAYVVEPATYTYLQKGQKMAEPGIWTFTLQKGAAGWRITAWTWALL